MDCKKADNLLIDFLYGELPPNDQTAFERHLQGCPEHTREVEKLRGVLNLVRAQEPEEVPEAVSARILQAARAQMPQKTKPSPFFSLIWNPAAAAAVLVVVVITVGLATHFMSEQIPEEDAAIEAARPLATAPVEIAEAPKAAAKAEEKREFAPAPEPRLIAKAPATEFARPPKLKEKAYKKSKSKKRRKPPSRKKAFKGTPAPTVKTPDVWGTRAKPKPSIATGARGGAAGPGDTALSGKTTSTVGKADAVGEGTAREAYKRAEREEKAKDEKKISKKASRPKEESRFAKPPPPAKAPPAPPPREEVMEAESTAGVAMDMEDDSYAQSSAPRAKKKQPPDYYQAAEGDLANKRYDAAVSKYRTFLSNNPTDPRAPTCRYRIAKALFLAGRC